MKKKFFLLLLALPMAICGTAQTDDSHVGAIDFEEDTTHVTSLKDILEVQDLAFEKSYRSNIISAVWKRKKFFSVSFLSSSLSGDNVWLYDPASGKMNEQPAKYKTDWGIAIKRSQVAAFHKKPIGGVLSFGLEYSPFDISVNHYSKDKDMQYNSSLLRPADEENTTINDEHHYMPWGSEMYTFSYGIHVGPSITVAPFARLKSPGAAHIRLQTYFTVGYRATFMLMSSDDKQDVNYGVPSQKNNFEVVSESNKLSWAHGLVLTWGVRLNWKGIGIGYELSNGGYTFKSLEKKIYGPYGTKFTESTSRISLTYIW